MHSGTPALPGRWAMDQCNPLPNARNLSLACEGAKLGCSAGQTPGAVRGLRILSPAYQNPDRRVLQRDP